MDNNQKFLKDLDNKLWTSADKLRSNLDAAVYEERIKELLEQFKDPDHEYYGER